MPVVVYTKGLKSLDTFESPNVIDAMQSNLNRRKVFPNDLVVAVVGEHFKHMCYMCNNNNNKKNSGGSGGSSHFLN